MDLSQWQHIWEKLMVDPWWFAGGLVILLLLFSLFLVSFFRNIQSLRWYYGAGFLCAALFLFSSEIFVSVVERMASYRPDWSLTYLVQTISFPSLVTEFVFYLGLYGFTGVLLLLLLLIWSLLTFQWARLKILVHRASDQSWFVLLFALLNISFHHIGFFFFGMKELSSFEALFQFLLFFFLFQLFIRLIDSARLHTSALFIEFSYSTGFLLLFLRFLLDWNDVLFLGMGSIQGLFLNHLFLFFFMLLLLGVFITFVISAFFVSPFYLDQYFHRPGWEPSFLRIFRDRKKMYAQMQIFKGIVFSCLIGFFFFSLLAKGMYLVLVFAFFFGFFGLFFLLDHQEDQRIRGDLVQKRVHSGHQKSFLP